MSSLMESLGIDLLTFEQRCQLLDEIWISLADEPMETEIPQDLKDELDRRLAAYRANPHTGSTWEEALVRLRGTSGPNP